MVKLMIGMTKALLLAFWAACILSLLSIIPESYGQAVLMVGAVLLLLHFFVSNSFVCRMHIDNDQSFGILGQHIDACQLC